MAEETDPAEVRAAATPGPEGGPGWLIDGLLMLVAAAVGGLVGWRASARRE